MAGSLKDKLFAEVRAALVAAGGDTGGVNKTALARKYIELGVPRATAFRWIASALVSADRPAPNTLKKQNKRSPARPAMPSIELLTVPPPDFAHITSPRAQIFIQGIEKCMNAANMVIAHSRHPDGRIRLGKTLMLASEHMRRVTETIERLKDTIESIEATDAFYDDLVATLESTAPQVHARVMARLAARDAAWCSQSSSAA